jgi:hypothetical protein
MEADRQEFHGFYSFTAWTAAMNISVVESCWLTLGGFEQGVKKKGSTAALSVESVRR